MAKRVSKLDTVSFNSFLQKRDPSLQVQFEKEYGDLYFSMFGDLVDYHKACLGKQSFCFSCGRRYWVWQRSKWCVYVSNQTGVQFEVDPSCTLAEAWDLWAEFREKISQTEKTTEKQ